MEIDLISIVIGILALCTFFVPIGYFQLSEKRKKKNAQKKFESVADKHGFHIGEMEIFRGGIVMGIDLENRSLMHLNDEKVTKLDLEDLKRCSFYKTQYNESTENEPVISMQEMGIDISFRNTKKGSLRLPIFKGKEGNTFGDESIITQRWVRKINSLQRSVKTQVIA